MQKREPGHDLRGEAFTFSATSYSVTTEQFDKYKAFLWTVLC